jgi:mRNA-degrading endonuclease RelE of RelBE toxin-antitoxin system
MREWRILDIVDDEQHRVLVQAIKHRRDAYRST